MSFPNEARGRLTEARNILIDRRLATNDPKERAAITEAIRELNENLGLLTQAALLDAATMVVDATKALEAVVRSSRLAPFDLHLKALEETIKKTGDLLGNGEVGEHLERAPEPPLAPPMSTPGSAPGGSRSEPAAPGSPPPTSPGGTSAPTAPRPAGSGTQPAPARPPTVPPGDVPASPAASTTPSSSTPPMPPHAGPATAPAGNATAPQAPERPIPPRTVAGAADLPPIATSSNFALLRDEFDAWFKALIVRDEHRDKVEWHTKQLLKNQSGYREVSRQVHRMPWAMVGVIHAMECCFNFAGHLHNGDPLTDRTRHVPSGQPQTGTPPFSWEESAVDALIREGFDRVADWSIPHMLYLLEKYNGFGYRKMGKPTPYLWSFSNLYEKGKYVADGRFDPQTVSKQCGAAVMLKSLLDKGTDLST
jgi:lysozyme family protein